MYTTLNCKLCRVQVSGKTKGEASMEMSRHMREIHPDDYDHNTNLLEHAKFAVMKYRRHCEATGIRKRLL